jgi:hypothetical protein
MDGMVPLRPTLPLTTDATARIHHLYILDTCNLSVVYIDPEMNADPESADNRGKE